MRPYSRLIASWLQQPTTPQARLTIASKARKPVKGQEEVRESYAAPT
jgi:hypothetical protein